MYKKALPANAIPHKLNKLEGVIMKEELKEMLQEAFIGFIYLRKK
jgi:hypothetical protein